MRTSNEKVIGMNRETRLDRDGTIVVVDDTRRRRNLIIAVLVGLLVLALAFFLFNRANAPADGKAGAADGENRAPVVAAAVGRSRPLP